jgi:hypothetical protein
VRQVRELQHRPNHPVDSSHQSACGDPNFTLISTGKLTADGSSGICVISEIHHIPHRGVESWAS